MNKKYGVVIIGIFIFVTAFSFADGPPVPAGGGGTTGAEGVQVSPVGGGPAGASNVAAAPGIGGMLLPFGLMFFVIYFLMIRPQQKKLKDQESMLSGLKHGDDVISSSGILGKITGITEKVVTLEIADNVRVKMLKNQISQIVKGQV